MRSLLCAPLSSSRGTGSSGGRVSGLLFSQRTKLEAMGSSAFFYLKSLVGPDLSCHLGFHPYPTCAESSFCCPVYSNCPSQVRPALFRSHPISSTEILLFSMSQVVLIFCLYAQGVLPSSGAEPS